MRVSFEYSFTLTAGEYEANSGRGPTSDSSRRNSMPNEEIHSETLSAKKSRRNVLSPVRYVRS